MSEMINKLTVKNHFYMAAVQVTYKKGVVKTELVNVMFENLEQKIPQFLLSSVNSQACRLVAERNKLKPEFINSAAIVSINYLGLMTAEEMFSINDEKDNSDATPNEPQQPEPTSGDMVSTEPV